MSCCGDVMKPITVSSCCTPQDTPEHAAKAMRDSGCGCSPVVENTENLKLVGVVTERDVCCGVAADNQRASEIRLEKIMRPASACCGADEPVAEARRKLHEHRATSLPAVNKGAVAAAPSAFTTLRGRKHLAKASKKSTAIRKTDADLDGNVARTFKGRIAHNQHPATPTNNPDKAHVIALPPLIVVPRLALGLFINFVWPMRFPEGSGGRELPQRGLRPRRYQSEWH